MCFYIFTRRPGALKIHRSTTFETTKWVECAKRDTGKKDRKEEVEEEEEEEKGHFPRALKTALGPQRR